MKMPMLRSPQARQNEEHPDQEHAKELNSSTITDFLNEEGIQDDVSLPYEPSTNGKVERVNRTINNIARKLLLHCELPSELWSYAVLHGTMLYNALPRKTPHDWHSPDAMYLGIDQSEVISALRSCLIFGEHCFGLKAKKLRDGKYGSISTESIYLGLDETQKFHLLLDLTSLTPYKCRSMARGGGRRSIC
jgi:hypothetical protein